MSLVKPYLRNIEIAGSPENLAKPKFMQVKAYTNPDPDFEWFGTLA